LQLTVYVGGVEMTHQELTLEACVGSDPAHVAKKREPVDVAADPPAP
jgi:hypothetical protein